MASIRDTLTKLLANDKPEPGTPLARAVGQYPFQQGEAPLEAPMLSPDDLIGTGIGKAAVVAGAKYAPLLMGMVKNPSVKKATTELIYHGTSPEFAKQIAKKGFDVTKSADNSIWFTSNPNIGEVAATGTGAVIPRALDASKLKLGGWDEADKYFTDELIAQGYHGLKFPNAGPNNVTHYRIFNPELLDIPK